MKLEKKMKKVEKSIQKRKGLCIICGDRVHGSEKYVEVTEGYCHKGCISLKARQADPVEA